MMGWIVTIICVAAAGITGIIMFGIHQILTCDYKDSAIHRIIENRRLMIEAANKPEVESKKESDQ